MSWKIVQVGGGTVTLPKFPSGIDDDNPVQIEEVDVDGAGPVLVSRFTQARRLTLSGEIWLRGTLNGTIEAVYLNPLRNMARQAVTITDPDSQFGGTWLMNNPKFHRVSDGGEAHYTFTIVFMRGDSIVVL